MTSSGWLSDGPIQLSRHWICDNKIMLNIWFLVKNKFQIKNFIISSFRNFTSPKAINMKSLNRALDKLVHLRMKQGDTILFYWKNCNLFSAWMRFYSVELLFEWNFKSWIWIWYPSTKQRTKKRRAIAAVIPFL